MGEIRFVGTGETRISLSGMQENILQEIIQSSTVGISESDFIPNY